MKIALCDDQADVLDELVRFLTEYCREYQREIQYEVFQSPVNLLAKTENQECYDALFLDILMKENNGIEVARAVRQRDRDVKIIFLTSSSEYAVQSYTVDAFYYQLKPICKEDFIGLLEKLFMEWQQKQEEYFVVRCQNGIQKIHIHQLEYCEVINRKLVFFLHNGSQLTSNMKIQEAEKILTGFDCFVRPHRSYLINMKYVEKISQKYIIMDSMAEIPIPHGKYTRTKNCYLEYMLGSTGRLV